MPRKLPTSVFTAHSIMNVEPGMIYIPPPPDKKLKNIKSIFVNGRKKKSGIVR